MALFSGKVELRMQSDDYLAADRHTSTDEEGNQVENQEYIGTTGSPGIIKVLEQEPPAMQP